MSTRRVISCLGASFNTAPQYTSFIQPTWWQTDEIDVKHRWLQDAAAHTLKVEIDTAPGVGKSWTFTILVNSVASDLAVTISDLNTSAENLTDVACIREDDFVSLRLTSSGSPGSMTSLRAYGVCVDPLADIQSCYGGVPTGAGGAMTRLFFPRVWHVTPLSWIADVCPFDATLKKLTVDVSDAPGVGSSVTYTVYQSTNNGSSYSATAATVTISGTDTTGSWTGSLALGTADLVQLRYTETGTPDANLRAKFAVRLHPGDDFEGDSYLCGVNDNGAVPYDVARYSDWHGLIPWDTSISDVDLVVPADFSLYDFVCRSSSAPGPGDTWTWDTLKDGAITGITAAQGGSEAAESDHANSFPFVAGDRGALRVTPFNTPDTGAVGAWAWRMRAFGTGWYQCDPGDGSTFPDSEVLIDGDAPSGSYTRDLDCVHGSYSRTTRTLSGSYQRTLTDKQGQL